MKTQFQKGSGNKQTSNDPNTIQVQVGSGVFVFATMIFIALMTLAICAVVLEKSDPAPKIETSK